MGASGVVAYFLPSLIGPVGHGYVCVCVCVCACVHACVRVCVGCIPSLLQVPFNSWVVMSIEYWRKQMLEIVFFSSVRLLWNSWVLQSLFVRSGQPFCRLLLS